MVGARERPRTCTAITEGRGQSWSFFGGARGGGKTDGMLGEWANSHYRRSALRNFDWTYAWSPRSFGDVGSMFRFSRKRTGSDDLCLVVARGSRMHRARDRGDHRPRHLARG